MQLTFPDTTADWFVACAYVLWIVITACGVLRCRHRAPGLLSTLAPYWPLFAPDPINYDYDLAFRVRHDGEEFSSWQPLPMSYSRTLSHGIWNPRFDEQLFCFRLCQAIVELPETNPRIGKLRQQAHDVLLSLVAVRGGAEPERVQFRITARCPLDPEGAAVVFLSRAQK
jgi:hypothetical protein